MRKYGIKLLINAPWKATTAEFEAELLEAVELISEAKQIAGI